MMATAELSSDLSQALTRILAAWDAPPRGLRLEVLPGGRWRLSSGWEWDDTGEFTVREEWSGTRRELETFIASLAQSLPTLGSHARKEA